MCDLVVSDKVAGNSLSIVRTKELRRRMPKLTSFIVLFGVQCVFELGISLPQDLLELELVADTVEVERIARIEDDSSIGEVPIMRVV